MRGGDALVSRDEEAARQIVEVLNECSIENVDDVLELVKQKYWE